MLFVLSIYVCYYLIFTLLEGSFDDFVLRTGQNFFNAERFTAVWEWGAKLQKNVHIPAPKLSFMVSATFLSDLTSSCGGEERRVPDE